MFPIGLMGVSIRVRWLVVFDGLIGLRYFLV